MDEELMLEVNSLSKHYQSFRLADITFSLPKGYIMGLIGPNGAGKTTTIKLILNMIQKSEGSINVFGLDSVTDEVEIKKHIGAVFDSSYFVEEWRPKDIEDSVGAFYDSWDSKKYWNYIKRFGLDPLKRVKELSKGMKMKLMLACAFSYDTRLLILDEPTSGLDPVSRDDLLEILLEYIEDGEHSVLFSTHITSDLEKVADYITFLNRGEEVYTGGKDELIDAFRLVKGGREELNDSLQKKLIGARKYSSGFEGLIRTEDLKYFEQFTVEPVTIEEIMVFVCKGEDKND